MSLYTKLFSSIFLLLTAACSSSSYLIHSNPPGVSVFHVDDKENKQLIGETPLTYSKSALPSERPFTLSFEKEGYVPQIVPIAPTDDARTTVNVNLKLDPATEKQPNVELNKIINRIIRAQNMIYKKRIQSALVELDQILKEKPDIVQAHIMRGTCYYILNELPTALESWKTALSLEPDNKELKSFLASKNIVIKGK